LRCRTFMQLGNCLPCGSCPLRRFPGGGQLLTPGVTNLRVTLPSQRFSRSQGLLPPATCRPCFMPVPPMGFCPSGFLHSRSDRLFRASCPLAVCLLSWRCVPCCGFRQSSLGLHSHSAATFLWTAAFLQQPHFRALLPAGDRSLHIPETGRERRDPRGLHPP
jgi:hypothetical protein